MIYLCSAMSCFPLKRRRHKMFGCSSSHHLTCLLSSPPAHPLHTWSMHTRPHKHTATTRSFEELSLFHSMLNHVQWTEENYIHYDRISEHGVGGELLPSTGNNLDTSKRPGIKGLFFFSPHQENFSSLIRDWERLKGFLLMQCVLKIMELYRFLLCPFWECRASWSCR